MAFNQKTDLIKGEALMLYVSEDDGTTYKPVAYASTHTLSINGDTIDNKQWLVIACDRVLPSYCDE